MPASTESPERQNGKLPTGLLWAGVGVAPLAALALLVGSGERSLRAAIGLALLAVVLIGLAIVLRPAADSVKVELEDTIYDEIDVVRDDVRNDITTAARATHRAFSEKFQHLQETVDQLRAQVESMRATAAPPSPHPAAPRPGTATGSVPAGVVRHTETVQVTTRSTIVDPHLEEPPQHTGRATPTWSEPAPTPSARPGGRRRAEEDEPWPPAREYGSYPVQPDYAQPTRQPNRPTYPGSAYSGSAQSGSGHSGSGHSGSAQSGSAHAGSAYAGSSYSPEYEESWTDQQLRSRLAEAQQAAPAPPPAREPLLSHEDTPRDRWNRRATPDQPAPAEPDWSGVRAGDRWAAVRNDERGSELRMGERRTSVHSDERGSELRIEDRWAAVRRDEPRAGRQDSVSWDGDRWTDQRSQRALPAHSDEPSAAEWLNQWPPPEQEPRRRRYADDY